MRSVLNAVVCQLVADCCWLHFQERQVLPEKPEVLFGTVSGESTVKVDGDEVMEPDELGIRLVEHGQIVSTTNPP